MSDTVSGANAPMWLRIVAALGLIWNCFGVYAYLQTVGVVPGARPGMTAADMPVWVTGSFAVSVFAGLLGCLGLVLLARWSKPLLLLSFLALLVNDAWAFLIRTGPAESPLLPALVNLVAIVLVWLAYSAGSKGWLR
jgi:hypothetical protein